MVEPRNPFKGDYQRRSYDAAVKCYNEKGRTFFYQDGTRCRGSGWATEFWRGFDGVTRNWDASSKQSVGYIMWRAGRDVAKAEAKNDPR